MTEQTVEVGDTEVEIRETEDGFEAVEVDSGPNVEDDGLYIVAMDDEEKYGCVVPNSAEFYAEKREESDAYNYRVAWNPDDNLDDDLIIGASHEFGDEHSLDGHANVHTIELILGREL